MQYRPKCQNFVLELSIEHAENSGIAPRKMMIEKWPITLQLEVIFSGRNSLCVLKI